MKPERSWAWHQASELHAQTATDQLRTLQEECSDSERELRTIAFLKAERFIAQSRESKGVAAPVKQSFKNPALPKLRKTARVDIDVFTGLAFV